MNISLRDAISTDAQTIVKLVQELAVHEKKPLDTVGITEQRVQKYCFSQQKCFDCCLAFADEQPVAYGMYSFRFSGWRGQPVLYLEDLFVLPEFREQGIGSALLAHISSIAREKECAFMEWLVFDWNEQAQKFYERLGTQLRKDFIVCRTELGESL